MLPNKTQDGAMTRYHWERDGMRITDMPVPGEPQYVLASDHEAALAAAEARGDRLEGALKEYGRHTLGCQMEWLTEDEGPTCTCGWDEQSATLDGGQPPAGGDKYDERETNP